jgi:CBS domain-containing protein
MTRIVHEAPRDLARVAVVDAMTAGVLTCPLETPLRDVARLMAERRVHCVVTRNDGDGRLWGVVSDRDLVAAAAAGELDERTAGEMAATPALTVAPRETLERAAQLLTEHAVGHLVVVEPRDGRPVGVLSTLDVARTAADLEAGDTR